MALNQVKGKKPRKDLLEVAYHEAGHIIAAHLQWLPIYSVEINTRRGHAIHSRLGAVRSASDYRQVVKANLIVCFAGIEAQMLFNPDADEERCRSDFWSAIKTSAEAGLCGRSCVTIGDDAHWDYLQRYRNFARTMIRANARQVGVLAEWLCAKRKADEKQLRAFLKKIFQK